jgi:hypothetical protein
VSYKSLSNVEKVMNNSEAGEAARSFAYMEEWNYSGASAPPEDHAFSEVRLKSVMEFLKDGERERFRLRLQSS